MRQTPSQQKHPVRRSHAIGKCEFKFYGMSYNLLLTNNISCKMVLSQHKSGQILFIKDLATKLNA